MIDKQFRFQDLEIWRKGAAISGQLFELADQLDQKRLYRFAEQMRAATLSITNNIAEGSGSVSDPDFANILLILSQEHRLETATVEPLLGVLEEESRMILAFMRKLKS